MSRPSLGVRASWLAAIALQVSLPGVAAVADARIGQAAAAETTHVESQTTRACVRVHPPDCGLCRFLTATFEVPRLTALPAGPPGQARTPAAMDTRIWLSPRAGHPHSRAPPSIS